MATPAKPRIDWRKLLLPFVFIMVLPTLSAILVDFWLETFPIVTIVAILICFPTAGFLVTKRVLNEMDRVIAEVAPPFVPEAASPETETAETLPEYSNDSNS